MSRVPPPFVGLSLLLALLAASPAIAQEAFVVPSQLDVTTINGVTSDEPVVTSNSNVAVGFQTNALQNATWIVFPVGGTTGSSAVFPPTNSLGVIVPPASFNTPFTIQLGIKGVAPLPATTLPVFTGAGTKQVIVDTEPPEVTVTEIRVGDQSTPYTPGREIHVNGDFTVVGTVTDNVASPEDITLEAQMSGTSAGTATPESSGRFEINISVGSLPDGDYDLELLADDKTDDESQSNRRTFRLEM